MTNLVGSEMNANRDTLDSLFRENQIEILRGRIFDSPPVPAPSEVDFDRLKGMMLGLAVGDALGNTTEGLLPNERREQFGGIRDYLPNRHADGSLGLPSDDTQLAFWTLDQLNVDRGFEPENVAARFCSERIFGIGSAMKEFVGNYRKGKAWHESGARSAGNGALMRIAPVLIPHLRSGTMDLWVDATLLALITHNDSASISSCLALVNMLWQLLQMKNPPQPDWWLETYVETARDLESGTIYKSRGGMYGSYEGPLWRFVEEKVAAAFKSGLSVVEACNSWYSGAYLLETVPSCIFILMKHGDNLEEAIVRAVNDTKDNDTIAAIVGAAVGALHGRARIPERWVSGLLGRTAENDDGKVFDVLEEAKRLWL